MKTSWPVIALAFLGLHQEASSGMLHALVQDMASNGRSKTGLIRSRALGVAGGPRRSLSRSFDDDAEQSFVRQLRTSSSDFGGPILRPMPIYRFSKYCGQALPLEGQIRAC
jgi:hypothetical protein